MIPQINAAKPGDVGRLAYLDFLIAGEEPPELLTQRRKYWEERLPKGSEPSADVLVAFFPCSAVCLGYLAIGQEPIVNPRRHGLGVEEELLKKAAVKFSTLPQEQPAAPVLSPQPGLSLAT